MRSLTLLLLAIMLLGSPALGAPQGLPAPPLVADGETPALLHVIAPPGLRIRARAPLGEVRAIEPVEGGYQIVYLPPAVPSSTTTTLHLRLRGGTVHEDLELPLRLHPGWGSKIELNADPLPVPSGRSTTLTLRPAEGPATAPPTLRAVTSTGTVGKVVPSPDGSYLTRFTAPGRLTQPGYAVALVIDPAAPTERASALVLPLTAERALSFEGPPGHEATLEIGDRTYGPTPVSRAGDVSFRVEVHPDQRRGTLSFSGPTPSSEPRDLPLSPNGGVVLAPLPERVPAKHELLVPVGCVTPAGVWCEPDQVQVEVSEGSIGPITTEGSVLFIPWSLPAAGTPAITVTAFDERASARLRIVPDAPPLDLEIEPASLSPGGTLRITAQVANPDDPLSAGRHPSIVAQGARTTRRPSRQADGSYVTTFQAMRDAGIVEIFGWVPPQPTGQPARHLLAWPITPDLPADGSSTTTLLILAVDALGMPVPETSLDLRVVDGDLAVPEKARTDRHGLASVQIRSGRSPGHSSVEVQGAGREVLVSMWQTVPQGRGQAEPGPPLPPSGSADELELLARWRSRLPTLTLTPSGIRQVPIGAVVPKVAPKRAASTSVAPPLARLRGALVNAPFRYTARVDGDQANQYAPASSFSTAALFGQTFAHLDGEIWPDPDRRVGLDLRARAGVYRVAVGTDRSGAAPIEVEVGARYRAWVEGPWSAYAGLGLSRLHGGVIRYADPGRATASFDRFGVLGPRIGGGLRYSPGPLLIELDAQTVWTPGPSVARLELRSDLPVADELALTVALGGDARHHRRPAEDLDARIRLTQLGGELRIGVALRFD
ncbi:MAG: hypothetical protein EA397_11230 [Deltaproteobacteria bacterium]|nr:MAG: hypothetical protein EA397_11230 [Deltaproteobacteria bacterium]